MKEGRIQGKREGGSCTASFYIIAICGHVSMSSGMCVFMYAECVKSLQ